MQATVQLNNQVYRFDTGYPIEISIPLYFNQSGPNAWYATIPEATPIKSGSFVGSVQAGGTVNFYQLRLTPHGNGTHTESVGHIAPEWVPVSESLRESWFLAQLISLYPTKTAQGDRIITQPQLAEVLPPVVPRALLIRTLPNDPLKLKTNYSGANPPYLSAEAAEWLVAKGVEQLLIDLPSIDPESDGGALAAHRAFWNYPAAPRTNATITELIYVPSEVPDGVYLLELQIPPFMIDAAPSRPRLYQLV